MFISTIEDCHVATLLAMTESFFILRYGFSKRWLRLYHNQLTHSVLYTGVTSDIIGRIWEHKNKTHPNSFTAKYNCDILVYYLFYPHIEEAIAAEKSIKATNRNKKIKLINELNPEWNDLYAIIKE